MWPTWEMVRYQVRISGGSLRGRRLRVASDPKLRPLSDRARQALFNLLGDAVPRRAFYDLFAGTGAVGIEALSRGASTATFVERDTATARRIVEHLNRFGVGDRGRVRIADAYRWVGRHAFPTEPVNVFVGPPFDDLRHRSDELERQLTRLQDRLPPLSTVVVQTEAGMPAPLPRIDSWRQRRYGRTVLWLWTRPQAVVSPASTADGPGPQGQAQPQTHQADD